MSINCFMYPFILGCACKKGRRFLFAPTVAIYRPSLDDNYEIITFPPQRHLL